MSDKGSAEGDKPPSTLRAAVTKLIKLAVALGILYWLFQRGDLDKETLEKPLSAPATLLLIFTLATVGLSMSGLRWWLLLGAIDIRIPLRDAVRLTWIGHFWNMVIPGAVSGDLVKMYYIGRQVPESREESWGTVLADRLIGLGALVSLSTLAALTQLEFVAKQPKLQASVAFMVVLLLGFVSGALVVALGIGSSWRITAWFGKKLSFAESIRRLYTSLRELRRSPGRVAAAFAISFFAHLISVSCAYLYGRLFTDALDVGQYYALMPIALFSNAIPISPGGLGVGETILGQLFEWTGAAAAPGELAKAGVSVMIWHRLNFYVLACIGGVLHALYREKRGEDPRDQEEPLTP